MAKITQIPVRDSNPFFPSTTCECCENGLHHEPWCFTVNPATRYAYQIVLEPSELTELDRLILHSLGVIWGPNRGR
jgi:hypothetical protein